GGLTSKLGLQNVSSGGVILIKTKTAEFKQPFNASINTIAGNNTFKTAGKDKNSTLQSYNVILNQGLDKFAWRTSAVFNKAVNNLHEQDINHNFQLNTNVRYKPLEWLELEGSANYVPQRGNLSFNEIAQIRDISEERDMGKTIRDGVLAARFQPIKGLTNEVKFINKRVTETFTTNTRTAYLTGSQTLDIEENRRSSRLNNSTLINELSYQFTADRDRIK